MRPGGIQEDETGEEEFGNSSSPIKRRPHFAEDYEENNDDDSAHQIIDPDASIAFNNRRRMAWLALLSMIFFMFTLVFDWPIKSDPERIKILQEPIVWFFLSMTAIIGAYMGFTSQIMSKAPGMKVGGGVSSLLGINRGNSRR